MFKWPDPPDAQIIVKEPLIIYLAGSVATALVIGVPFYFMAWQTREESSLRTSLIPQTKHFWRTSKYISCFHTT
jgi:hypothetical protein